MRFTRDPDSVEVFGKGWLFARLDDEDRVELVIAEGDSAGIDLPPEEAIRFGFHLAGLGAIALRRRDQ